MAKQKLTYEIAAAQLDDILTELSSEETSLDKSLQLYAKAAELIAFCNETLKNAQMQIDEINARIYTEAENDL